MDNSGSYGWLLILAFAIVYDIIVIRKGKQSLSGAIWKSSGHPFYEPAILGLWTSLTYHFFIDKRYPRRRHIKN